MSVTSSVSGHLQHGSFTNPVIDSDFPDPNCIEVANTFFVFATNFGETHATSSHIQLASSKDLVNYQLQPDALPKLPSWAKPGRTWAPNVTHVGQNGDNRFVLYFVAWDIESDRQAIGLATSKNVEGPYKSTAPRPFILQVMFDHVHTVPAYPSVSLVVCFF